MTPTTIEALRDAWRVGLTEFISTDVIGEKSQLSNLFLVIKNIRYHNLLREGKNETFIRKVYDDIRNVPDFYVQLMSAATAFNLMLPDQVGAVEYFLERAIVYSADSAIVDKDTLERRAPDTALKSIVQKNLWLFMLLVASTLEQVTLEVVVANGRKVS